MKLPSLAKWQPVKKRPDGKTAVCGCTPREWGVSCLAYGVLYVIVAALFTICFVISLKIRASGNTFVRPGSDTFVDDDSP
jgi:hypothetical protein